MSNGSVDQMKVQVLTNTYANLGTRVESGDLTEFEGYQKLAAAEVSLMYQVAREVLAPAKPEGYRWYRSPDGELLRVYPQATCYTRSDPKGYPATAIESFVSGTDEEISYDTVIRILDGWRKETSRWYYTDDGELLREYPAHKVYTAMFPEADVSLESEERVKLLSTTKLIPAKTAQMLIRAWTEAKSQPTVERWYKSERIAWFGQFPASRVYTGNPEGAKASASEESYILQGGIVRIDSKQADQLREGLWMKQDVRWYATSYSLVAYPAAIFYSSLKPEGDTITVPESNWVKGVAESTAHRVTTEKAREMIAKWDEEKAKREAEAKPKWTGIIDGVQYETRPEPTSGPQYARWKCAGCTFLSTCQGPWVSPVAKTFHCGNNQVIFVRSAVQPEEPRWYLHSLGSLFKYPAGMRYAYSQPDGSPTGMDETATQCGSYRKVTQDEALKLLENWRFEHNLRSR